MFPDVILLAAGRGSRMGETTRDKPKCLTQLAGRSLLDWQLSALRKAGAENIHIVRGYRKELLAPAGVALIDNDAWAETNMVATLRCADAVLTKHDCVVSYSDIVYHPDHVRALAASPGDIAIAYDTRWAELWSLRFFDPLADAETFRQESGRLVEIGGRAHSMEEIAGQYMGLLRFTPRGWHQFTTWVDTQPQARRQRVDMTSALAGLVAEGVRIDCVPVHGRWCEVDSETDAARYAQRMAESAWPHDWREG